ncbi:B3 domain-containing protein REM1-like [Salvia divinorum]|uniref:B3 domain-containing protein REM1-like n=1 Tax=Salvia divinorum TaxID=28513 RepID=A0ABD1GLW0_SALDI
MAANYGALDYHSLPSFMKVFSVTRKMEELRLPPEWVRLHEGDLPFQCRLVMPNGMRWTVRNLRISSGCLSRSVGHNLEIKTGSGCPPRSDLEILAEDEEYEASYSPDVYTSDDYVPSAHESESTDGDDYVEDTGVLDNDGYLLVTLKLTRTHIRHTLEIPSNKIWVKQGWRRFKEDNALTTGVHCHFKLVDAREVQFYVWFDRD